MYCWRPLAGVANNLCVQQIKTAQDLSTLIRDLQELWLFGGLDTLSGERDGEEAKKKAVEVAEMMEGLARRGRIQHGDKEEDKKNGVRQAGGGEVEKM